MLKKGSDDGPGQVGYERLKLMIKIPQAATSGFHAKECMIRTSHLLVCSSIRTPFPKPDVGILRPNYPIMISVPIVAMLLNNSLMLVLRSIAIFNRAIGRFT